MIEIAVGSENPTKLRAVRLAFNECTEEPVLITGFSVDSGVSDQPMTDEETMAGARTRAYEAASRAESARYSLGMEGGMRVVDNIWFEMGWVCLYDTVTLKTGIGGTPALRIPSVVRSLMEQENMEESQAVAAFYNTDTVTSRDCSSVISGGLLSGEKSYRLAVITAFADLRNQQ